MKKQLLTAITVTALTVTSVLGLGSTITSNAAEELSGTVMYRMYNPNSGEHFYTSQLAERNNLEIAGWNYEGYGFVAGDSNDEAVYRMYNPNAGDHHYTKSTAERDMLTQVGWNYEGIGWYSPTEVTECTADVYRLYNPYATGAGSHHYTTNESEKDFLVQVGWTYEGTSFKTAHEVDTNGIKTSNCAYRGNTGDAVCRTCGKTHTGTWTPCNKNNHENVSYMPSITYYDDWFDEWVTTYENSGCGDCGASWYGKYPERVTGIEYDGEDWEEVYVNYYTPNGYFEDILYK